MTKNVHLRVFCLQLNELEQEFLLLQSFQLEDMLPEALEEAAFRTDNDGNNVTYRIDVLWYHLCINKIPGTNKSKFENLFKLYKIILCIIHRNAEEESVFSGIRKNLTPQRASLEIDGTLASIINFQLNRTQGEKCYQYNPSEKVISRSKKVNNIVRNSIKSRKRFSTTFSIFILSVASICK